VVCFSYSGLCYGNKVLGYSGGVRPVHIAVIQYIVQVKVKVKVKQSRHRPGVAQRVPGS
jgi:hypothetical protein